MSGYRVRVAMRAVYLAFALDGLAYASWAARIPQVRDRLHVDPAGLGLLLFCMALGSVVAVPLAGVVVHRWGEAASVTAMSLLLSAGLAGVAVGVRYGPGPVAAGLFLVGFGIGAWDVAVNVQGAAVERALGRALMPRFHAGWSVGTVAGAALGAAMVALHVSVTVHLVAVAVLVAAAVPAATRRFLPPAGHADGPGTPRRNPFRAWTERRTLLIGLFLLCMAFTEGAGNEWLGIALIDGYRVPVATGTVGFALFLGAMTAARWCGPGFIDRYGRVPALRVSAATALVGLLLVVWGHVLAVALAGTVLLGLGTALGFPVGLSAAADDPRHAAGRVSAASSIGYVAFVAGPPAIGMLGNRVGVLRGLSVVAVLLAAATLLCGATAPQRPATGPAAPRDRAAPGTR